VPRSMESSFTRVVPTGTGRGPGLQRLRTRRKKNSASAAMTSMTRMIHNM
jgi:hypothetical protein